MSQRIRIPASTPSSESAAAATAEAGFPLSMQDLVQLADQIKDAVLVVEHPQLALQMLAAREHPKVA